MANYPSTSLTITFVTDVVGGGEDDAILEAEVVSADNDGKSNFFFSDAPVFRLYKSPNVSVRSANIFISHSGASVSLGSFNNVDRDIQEVLTFAGAAGEDENSDGTMPSYRQSSVAKPVYGTPSYGYKTGNIGAITAPLEGYKTFVCSKKSSGPLDPVFGICRVTYDSKYALCTLSGVTEPTGFGSDGFNEYPVIVYIIGVVE